MAAAGLVSLSAVVATDPASAQPSSASPRRAQAHRLVIEGRCPAALEVLARLVRELPSDPEPWLWTGQCEVELEDYAAAQSALETARSLAPENGEVRLLLAIALYHQEEFGAASDELESAALLLGEERAEIDLYRGLLLLTRSDTAAARDAAAWLEHARALNARAVEPMASFYAGLGWSTGQDEPRARVALERVIREWPDTEWSQQAERLLAELDGKRQRFSGSLRAGLEYDTNAVLQGQGSPLPDEISSERDLRGIWQGVFGGEILRRGPWMIGAAASYSGTVYREIGVFDTQFPGAMVWVDRRLGDATTLRFTADTGYAFVDYDDFLWTWRATLSSIRQWSELGTSEAFLRFWRDDFFVESDDVPGTPIDEGTERNRDGNGFALGLLHSAILPVDWPFGDLTVRGSYLYESFSARGTEYSFEGHTLAGGFRADLPWQLTLDAAGSFTWRPYRHPTTFPDSGETTLSMHDRNEMTARAEVTLERPITRWLTGSIGWRYERNHSNADAFDYDRHVVGAYLTASFGY